MRFIFFLKVLKDNFDSILLNSLPFVYICMTKYCSCQVKLCEKCLTEHETENQNSNIMKI